MPDKNIKLAKYAGFCYGVKRAVETVKKLKAENPDKKVFVSTLHLKPAMETPEMYITNPSTGEYMNPYGNVSARMKSGQVASTFVFDAKAKPAKFSGGEQRLLSVLSVIATRSQAELMIIDEPLNNLDFINARNISNLINKVIRENSKMGLLMISHCRIFPFINREINITANGVSELSEPYVCHSCFGEPDENGIY